VRQARFWWLGHWTIFSVDCDSETTRTSVAKYLQEHRAIGTGIRVVESWEPGAPWPELYDSFAPRERELIESCNTTTGSLLAVLQQLHPWIRDGWEEPHEGGEVRLAVVARPGATPSSDDLDSAKRTVLACCGHPGILVAIRVANAVERPEPERFDDPKFNAMMRGLTNQSSRDGITDPVLHRAADEDEDFYRTARDAGFQARRGESHTTRPRRVFIPVSARDIDVRRLLLLYDCAYVDCEICTDDECARPLGLARPDFLDLVAKGLLTPVVPERFGVFPEKSLRELLDRGTVITPKRLAAFVATHLLDANPLWRLPKQDHHLAKACLDSVRLAAERDASLPARLRRMLLAWCEFQSDGCADFMTSLTNQSALAPLHYGPGALAERVFGPPDAPRNAATAFHGRDIAYAQALGAGFLPPQDEEHARLCDVIGAIAGRRPIDNIDNIEVLLTLDQLFEAAGLTVPADMPLDEWLAFCQSDRASGVRQALSAVLEGRTEDRETLDLAYAELRSQLDRMQRADDRAIRLADNLEFAGIVADAILMASGSAVPFGSTLLSMLIKQLAPRIWAAMENDRSTQAVKDQLIAMNHLTSPAVAKLHQVRRRLGRA